MATVQHQNSIGSNQPRRDQELMEESLGDKPLPMEDKIEGRRLSGEDAFTEDEANRASLDRRSGQAGRRESDRARY